MSQATLETNYWIDSDRFGVPVSRYAWTLVQHADGHPDFQEEVLHRYDTQPTWKCEDGKLTLHPMEDPTVMSAELYVSIGAVFGALNSMYSSVSVRGKEIATLRALGFGPTSILFSTMIESTLLALDGGVLGALSRISYLTVSRYRL